MWILTYFLRRCGPGRSEEVSSGNPSAASRIGELSAPAPTCDAAASGCRRSPDSVHKPTGSVLTSDRNVSAQSGAAQIYLDLLNDGLERRRAVGPLLQQLHGLVEVLHVLSVHFEEGGEFLQDVADPRCGRPAAQQEGSDYLTSFRRTKTKAFPP